MILVASPHLSSTCSNGDNQAAFPPQLGALL